ncbi:SusC/RagA family TonB-linked outer membrane protein [Flavimarina sp. Hel_I_48]|uniref:SusC/RagA family TonB-linked outer membrane protein n=1 Tax=Flavimarina sp. Hel_I_48 TaxID=1392488 RepID=UPI0004DFCC83|nr:SusC/RagA family TonB-linked outer membrane protein [Flavimarina sp. Hel_I_48]
MKQLLLLCIFLFSAIVGAEGLQAQTVTGTISEPSGPLPGANVLVKGTTNGATTDFDGNYTINDVPAGAILVFSYVGFAQLEVPVNGQSTINATLEEDSNTLDEVVLIGYGQTTVRDATGSVSSVTAEDFNKGVITSPEQLIQGKTAGVQISESSGEPGAGINVRIRGTNSIRSGNNPLFVVDGIPLTTGGAPAGNVAGIGGSSTSNPLSFLNPNDIESISILKDASATAIYGSRGANGVIIIQTKSGRGASEGVFEFNSTVSFLEPLNKYDLLGREEFLGALTSVGNDANALDFGADSDFQDFYTRKTSSTRSDLSYSKSYSTGNVRASFGYSLTNGVVQNTNQEQISGRLNINQRLFDDKLTLSGQFSLSRVNDLKAPISGSAGSTGDLIGASITANPTYPLDPDFDAGGNVLNPVSLLENFEGISNTDRFLANASAEYQIIDPLSVKVAIGYDKVNAETTSVFASSVIGLNGTSNIGRGNYNVGDQENKLLEATLNFNKDFDNSNLAIVGGYSYQKFQRSGFGSEGAGFNTTDLGEMSDQLKSQYKIIDNLIQDRYSVFGYGNDGTYVNRLFPEINTTDEIPGSFNRIIPSYIMNYSYDNFDELQSYFVRANYTLAEKYLFTGTFRADGSSTFGENERYGYFPSGAFAWQLHKEEFMGDAFSTLKLRLGAGVVGSQEGLAYGQFIFRTTAAGGGINNDLNVFPRPGTAIAGGFPNPDLKWEETTDFNVGIDFGFNQDRFNGTVNLYRKETRDLLLTTQIAAPGSGTIFQNLSDGKIVNDGIEVSLNYDFIRTDNASLSTSLNVAYNSNNVEDIQVPINAGPINGNGLSNAFAQRLQADQPLYSYYMAKFTGFDPTTGNPTYFDFDGDGIGDPDADKYFVGEDAVPDYTAGLSINATYKNFDLSTYFNGQFGFSVYNATANAFFSKSALLIGKNVTRDVLGTNENPGSTVAVSTRFLEKADFVRLTTASLGYNVPLSGENIFKSMRLSFTGQNLFLITGYSGLDPEISANTGSLNASNIPTAGIDYSSYPRPITVTFGFNATF